MPSIFRTPFLLIFLIVYVPYYGVQCGNKRQIPVGGLFHSDNQDAEIAFRYALVRENMYNARLEFVPIIRRIDATDSYQAEKAACGLASEGVAAIFGPSSEHTSGIVASICNQLGIPHILAHWQPDEPITTDATAAANNHHYGASSDGDADADGDGPATVDALKENMDRQHAYTRNFFPDRQLYADVLGKLIADASWNGFTLLFDDNASLQRLQTVLQIHEPTGNPVTVRQLPAGNVDEVDYQTLLKEIQVSGDTHIILDCEPSKVLRLLQQANGLKLMEDYHNYIITSLDAHALDFAELKFTRANITTLRMMNPNSLEVMTAVHDWRQGEPRFSADVYGGLYVDRVRTEAALFHDAAKYFASALREFHVSVREVQPRALRCDGGGGGGGGGGGRRWEQGRHILAAMDQRTDEGATGRLVFDDGGRRADFYVEMLELNADGFKKIATWDRIGGLNYTRSQSEVYTQIQQSLQNKTVIVAARIGKPWLMWKPVEEGVYLEGNARFEGYSLDLIDGIANILKFQYRLEPVHDNAHGSFNRKTKKWNGLIKELLERRADLAICDLTITYERRTAVDFTMPFMTLGVSILFAKPRKEPPELFSFMNPLSVEVWLYMVTTYLGVSVVLFLVAKISNDDWENPHPCDDDPEELENLWNMQNSLWLTVGAIMQQGCDLLPKAAPTRLIASFWWFFALIVTASYTANLAAFLTKEQMEVSISNVEELAAQQEIKYGGMAGGSTLSFFKESNVSTYQKMWAVMEANPSVFVRDNDEGFDRVARSDHKYAFLCESSSIEFVVNRNCNLTQVGGTLDSKGYGIAMPVNSPYRTHISQTVLKMQEGGQLHRLKEKWWKPEDGGCSFVSGDADANPELGMDNVGGVFLVLIVGCGVGLLIGIMEFLWNLRQVVIDNRITMWDAFKTELTFACDLRKTTKPVFIDGSHSASASSQHSQSRSRTGSARSSRRSSLKSCTTTNHKNDRKLTSESIQSRRNRSDDMQQQI